MASSPKLFSMSILFLFALFSMQIHAREYFSKFPRVNINEKETTTREQKHETFVPQTTQKPEEQEPRFIPETQNGYGLYGHESGSSRPSFTTKETYEPYVTPVRFHPDEPYNSIPESSNNKDTYYYNKNAYEYLENGKYYYDVKSENNYYPNRFDNSRGVASRNEFNENRYNNMGRYHQNQEEFEESEEEFEP
ncbi:hypothetical protein GOBAR_DD36894 [Gossypium barbadense]|nr:hypothetical protein GOBAR_DD36894 [Gossypium barbadense]